MKKILIALLITIGLTLPGVADHLPEENWQSMNPTVQIVSYKQKFSGYTVPYGSGSGTLVSPSGKIVTNNHVIFDENEQTPLDAFEICITFDVKKQPLCHYTAQLIANDQDMDIAILQMEAVDVLGKPLPTLKYMDYKSNVDIKEQDEVQVVGYPASGGDTITITRGQVSGFDTFNEFKYIKTDTDFDHGSSGGTALDSRGNYIGIPTYIRSYAENVGYFLDLREARTWIDQNIDGNAQAKAMAGAELKRQMRRFIEANETLKHTFEKYPFLEINLPEGWHFFQIDDDRLIAAEQSINDAVGISVTFDHYPFPIDEDYLARLDEEFVDARQTYADFEKEPIVFAKQKGFKLTYTTYSQRNTHIYIPYGHALVGISYAIDLDKEERQLKAIEPVLASLRFTKLKVEKPDLEQQLKFERPAFELRVFDKWRIQKTMNVRGGNVLATAVTQGNFEGDFTVSYRFIPRDERQLTSGEQLDELSKTLKYQGARMLRKKEDVLMDGLPGYLYLLEYEGNQYQQIRKKLIVKLEDGDYEFIFRYDDLARNFDQNLPLIEKALYSFNYLGGETEQSGQFDFGVLAPQFIDIQYHRFATSITALADKAIVQGYANRFRPEFFARRADALKTILESKNHLEMEKGLGKEVDFTEWDNSKSKGLWFEKYQRYAQENGISNAKVAFRPYEAVRLSEALKWMIETYEVPVWQGKTRQWYTPYMNKAYELGWIPRGLDDPHRKLTRGELSYLVDTVYNQAK